MRESSPQRETGQQPQALVQRHVPEFGQPGEQKFSAALVIKTDKMRWLPKSSEQ